MAQEKLYQAPVVEHIIAREPGWMVKSGSGLICIFTLVLLLMAWFIRFPDSLSAKVTLQTLVATVMQRSNVEGYLAQVMVKEGQWVEQGQPVALVGGELDYSQLLALEELLENTNSSEQLLVKITNMAEAVHWEEMQGPLDALQKSLLDWQSLNADNSVELTRLTNLSLIGKYESLIQELGAKQQILKEQVSLLAQQLVRYEKLVSNGLLSKQGQEQAEQHYLTQQTKLNDLKVQVQLYRVKIDELDHQNKLQQIAREKQLKEQGQVVSQQRSELLGAIEHWLHEHLLEAKISGTLAFHQGKRVNQFIARGEVLFSIVPSEQSMDGNMRISGHGAGKVKPGQTVQIVLDNYPAAEFGYVTATVKSLNPVPDQNGLLVQLHLPYPLKTNFGKVLDAHAYQQGQAKIILEPRRLLSRFVDKIIFASSD